MKRTCADRALLPVMLLAGGVALAAAPPARLPSAWLSQPVVVDGVAGDWTALTPIEDAKLSVGVVNDGSHLYVSVSSSDQARRRQLLAGGLIIWLDARGGTKRTFGVRFPGIIGGDLLVPPEGSGPATTERRPTRPAGGPPAERFTAPPLTSFELLGPGDDDRRRFERAALTEIQVGRDVKEGILVFELRVTLGHEGDPPMGLGSVPGQTIGLGLETPKIERPETPGRGAGGGRPSGMGGMGGGGGMGRGGLGGRGMGGSADGSERGERPERARTLKLWTTVQLAKPA